MKEHVAPEAIVITDAYSSYTGLEKHFSKHITVKHTEGNYRTVGDKHTNNIEGFWSIFKRGVIGIYHYVSPQHLHRYCAEFEKRYNSRNDRNIAQFLDLVKNSDIRRVHYLELTSNS